LKLAERVGVFDRDFAIPNVYSGFRLISRNRSNLASSNLRRRVRPFTGVCRFFYFDGTPKWHSTESSYKGFRVMIAVELQRR
jgi:hypothetical protein